ncbi:HD-GYP domain-containing protein [Novosphingobium sp. NPDC080210]|uniref:HD-GYP domain-containing protein n=1 Tax=Novosphingobium sp. NPDC080210 TaxID=3390596 RepID=UPI003D038E88
MLKRIDPSQAEMGMLIHKLEGPWLKHPFWKTKFVIDDPEILSDLRDSDIQAVVIDVSRGRDVESHAPMRSFSPPSPPSGLRSRFAPKPVRGAPEPSAFNFRSTKPQTTAREFGHAAKVADRGRKIVTQVFIEARLGKSIKANAVEPVIEDIFASIQRNPHAFNGLMRCKQEAECVYRHALACSALMISLARQLKMTPTEIREAGKAGLLFDVGISQLPIDIADYQDDYRKIPHEILREHTTLGFNFLTASGLSGQTPLVALHHHERNDGSGYPAGLIGGDIPLLSRMAAVCDAYDELAAKGTDAHPVDPGEVVQRMAQMSGKFDPVVFDAFVQCIGIYPIGTFVELRSGLLAMVVDQDVADHSKPKVRTFFSQPLGERVQSEEIDLSKCNGQDEIMGLADMSRFEPEDVRELRHRMMNAVMRAA